MSTLLRGARLRGSLRLVCLDDVLRDVRVFQNLVEQGRRVQQGRVHGGHAAPHHDRSSPSSKVTVLPQQRFTSGIVALRQDSLEAPANDPYPWRHLSVDQRRLRRHRVERTEPAQLPDYLVEASDPVPVDLLRHLHVAELAHPVDPFNELL